MTGYSLCCLNVKCPPNFWVIFGKKLPKHSFEALSPPISPLRSCKKGKGNFQGGCGEGDGRWPAILVCPRPSWFQHWKFHTWEKALLPKKNIASHFIRPATNVYFLSLGGVRVGRGSALPFAELHKSHVEKLSVRLCRSVRGRALCLHGGRMCSRI